jgi:hypothetical protein
MCGATNNTFGFLVSRLLPPDRDNVQNTVRRLDSYEAGLSDTYQPTVARLFQVMLTVYHSVVSMSLFSFQTSRVC